MDENHPHTGWSGPRGLEAPCCKVCLELSPQYYETAGPGADLPPCWLVHGKRYVFKVLQALRVSPVNLLLFLLFVLVVHVPLLHWSSALFIFLPRVCYNLLNYLESLRITKYTVCIFILQIYFCEFALGYMFFIYPLTEVHKITRSSECYAAFLLAPAEGWSLFTL